MTEGKLREMLFELVEEVDAHPLAEAAWATAARRRRRGYFAAGVATTVTVVSIVAAAALLGVSPDDAPAAMPSSSSTETDGGAGPSGTSSVATSLAGPKIQVAPAVDAIDALPSLGGPLAALSEVPTSAPHLSDLPLPEVIAAVQRGSDSPLMVLGPNGEWRQLDVGVGEGDDERARLGATMISPDGHRLAFPSPEGLTIVDVTTAQVHSLSGAPGPVEYLTWLPADNEIAAGGDSGSAIYTLDGGMRAIDYSARDLASGTERGALVQLTSTEVVLEGESRQVTRVQLDPGTTQLDAWYGGGWLKGDEVARSGFINETDAQAVATVNVVSGRVESLLTFSYEGRSNGCCATLGWWDDETLLLRDMGLVLAWRPSTGELLRVASLAEGQDTMVALRP